MVAHLTFGDTRILWLLFSVPLLVFTHLYFMHHAKKEAIKFANFQTLQRITGRKILTKNILLLIVRCLVVMLLVCAAAGPTLWRDARENASDVVIAIDVSASMTASDMDGPRVEAAKTAAKQFVQQLDTAAGISVVQFSGLTEVVLAGSSDKDAVIRAIDTVQIKSVGGTDISGAMVTATNLLSTSPRGRVVLLITDGVSSVSLYDANPLEKAITYANKNQVVFHTIGIGSQTNAQFLPNLAAQAATFDEQNLKTIASSTGGSYAWAKNTQQLQEAYTTVIEQGSTGFVPLDLHFGFLFTAICILFLEWGLVNTRYRLIP